MFDIVLDLTKLRWHYDLIKLTVKSNMHG